MRVLERLGNDRVVMIIGVAIGIARGTNYTFLPGISDLSGHLLLLDDYIPVWSLGAVWYFAGLLSLCAIFIKRLRPHAYGMLIGLAALSAITFLASWILGFSPSGFVSFASYSAKVVMIYLLARTPSYDEQTIRLIDAEIAEGEKHP